MSRALALEDFASDKPDAFPVSEPSRSETEASSPMPEIDMLEAYENAYKSGWADCASAEAEERRGISVDLARNLKEATLTYETARRDVLAALGPFFEDIVATLLPRLAAAAVLPSVLAELDALANGASRSGIELHAAPATCPSLERLAESEGIDGMVVRPEPAFAEGQVSLRLGAERRDIDLASAADRIADAIASFQAQSGSSSSAGATAFDSAQSTFSRGAA